MSVGDEDSDAAWRFQCYFLALLDLFYMVTCSILFLHHPFVKHWPTGHLFWMNSPSRRSHSSQIRLSTLPNVDSDANLSMNTWAASTYKFFFVDFQIWVTIRDCAFMSVVEKKEIFINSGVVYLKLLMCLDDDMDTMFFISFIGDKIVTIHLFDIESARNSWYGHLRHAYQLIRLSCSE
jgi:hypothetical protein